MTGYQSKKAAAQAIDKVNWADHEPNGLAQPEQEPVNLLEARKIAAEYGTPNSQVDEGNLYFALSQCLQHIDAQPAQEPVGFVDSKLNPIQRTWVGLTEEETLGFTQHEMSVVKYVSKVLQEKNT